MDVRRRFPMRVRNVSYWQGHRPAGPRGMKDRTPASMLRVELKGYKDGGPQIIASFGASVAMLQALIRKTICSNRAYNAVG